MLKILSEKDIKRIHDFSLRILKGIGIKLPNEHLLGLFQKNGAEVDKKRQVVKIGEKIVKKYIDIAVRNQKEYYQKIKGGDKSYPRIDGWMIFSRSGSIFEYKKDIKIRKVSLKDVLLSIALGNELNNSVRISHFVEPAEYGKDSIDVISYYLLFVYSRKRNILSMINSLNSARCILDMAQVAADNGSELKNGHLLEYELLPVNNLEYSPEHLDIACEFAKRKVKLMAGHWCWMGLHTPMSYESAIVLSNANILAGIIIAMLLNPEQPYIDYVSDIFTVNLDRSENPLMGSPNQVIFSLAARQIADFYGFKVCLTNTGLTDSISNNFQSGFERGVTAALAMACGSDLMGLQGLVGANQGVSMQQLVIDNELQDYLNFIFSREIDLDDFEAEYKKIKSKGTGGDFLEDTLSVKNDYCYWRSNIFSSSKIEDWHENKNIEMVNKEIDLILKDRLPLRPVISQNKKDELERIMYQYINDRGNLDRFFLDIKKYII